MRPEPCGLPRLPELTVEAAECQGSAGFVCLTPAGFATLAAWLDAVAQYEAAVNACPYVRPGGDLRASLAGDPHLHP